MVAVVVGCRAEPIPLGEALVVVQTDVNVPGRVDVVRVDVLSETGTLLSTRDVPTPSAASFPLSFSVVGSDDGPRAGFVRLRAHPGGHVVSPRDLALGSAGIPAPPRSIQDACREPPELRLEEPVTLRRGSVPITTVLPYVGPTTTTCTRETRAGSVVVRFVAPEKGDYGFEVLRSTPSGADRQPGGDTTIAIRRECLFPTSQIACADDIDPRNLLSRLEVSLDAGTYFVVTGGDEPAAADLTLLASRIGGASTIVPPTGEPPSRDREPAPGVTIDRLVRLDLQPGTRGTVDVVLHGECLGSAVDLGAKSTCIDDPTRRVIATTEPLAPGLRRAPVRATTPWSGEAVVPCSAAPRPAGPDLDEEACVPGGAFALGDTLALGDGDFRSQPERVRVVDPFLLDRFEVSVGRYRAALRRGYVPVAPPVQEPGEIGPGHVCTWNVGASPAERSMAIADRERLPLNCLSWAEARAFCIFSGGDLPTEDQWELAATAAGRPTETSYPWGSDLATCDRSVFQRAFVPPYDTCPGPRGPIAVDDATFAATDRSPQGIVGLAGNLQEWLRDGFESYASSSWSRAGLRGSLDPAAEAPLRATRGADWAGPALFATGSARRAQPPLAKFDNLGFRCTRRGRP